MSLNLQLSDATANAAANAITALCNGGSLNIYDGAQPANANTAITTQNLLASLTFANPAFNAAAAGAATTLAITAATAVATGTAAWFRVFKSDGVSVVFDGTVGTATCDLIVNSTAFQIGANVSIALGGFTFSELEQGI